MMKVADSFEKRAARAELLTREAPAVAEPLAFAAKLFRLQGPIAAAVAARHEDAALAGGPADFPRLLELLDPLLSFAVHDGPPELSEVARARQADQPDTALARLSVYWSGERETADDYLSRAFLRPYGEVLAQSRVAPGRDLRDGGCPFCGAAAVISFRRDLPESNGAARYLVCGLCGTEWLFNRIRCPSCLEEDPVKLPSFQNEAQKGVRIEACETCKRYVKSIDLSLDARPIPEVDDLASLAMDLWALEQGWTRIEPGWAGI